MRKIFWLISSIVWIEIFFISHCECPEATETSNPGEDDSPQQNSAENDPYDVEFVFQSGNAAKSQIRTFQVGSRGYKVQADLGYLEKPYWPSQWIMTEEIFQVEGRRYDPSMGIVRMHWRQVKGENVVVVIIGNSAVNCDHEQIKERCKVDNKSVISLYPKKPFFSFSRDKKYKRSSPQSLATAVAGIIGMTDKGQQCGVGIAPKCTIGNIVIEPSSSNGSPENCANKISSKDNSAVALFVHAWLMPQHDYRNNILRHRGNSDYMNFVSPRTYSQLRPHVMGSGDFGLIANSCQTNEYASTDSSFVYGSVAYHGYLTPYSETCASLMGVTYSTSNGYQFYNNLITIPSSDNVLHSIAPKRTTTVSAAVAGGIITLIIDYYKKLHQGKSPSVNDLAFILAFSSSPDRLRNKNMLWFENGAGLFYSPQCGFGLPDLAKAIDLIEGWTSVGIPRLYECARFDKSSKTVQFNCQADTSERRSLTFSSNMICRFTIHDVPDNYFIQTATVEITAKLAKRGSMSAYMISPAGTVSCILEGRPYDTTRDNYKKLRLRTNHFMGEPLSGPWMIKIFTYKENSKPSFKSLYAFQTGPQSPSSPLNLNGDPNNPLPSDVSVPPPALPKVVPPVTTQGPPHSQNSETNQNDITGPHPAPSAEVNPPSRQASESRTSQDATNSQAKPVQPAAVDNTTPAHAGPPNTDGNRQSSTVGNGGTASGTSAPLSNDAPKDSAAPPNDASEARANEAKASPTPQKGGPAAPQNGGPAAPQNGGPGALQNEGSAAPQKGGPAAPSSPQKPRPASGTNVQSNRRSSTKPSNSQRTQSSGRVTNEVSQISVRFLLVETLPQKLEIHQNHKSTARTNFEFELMKLWADFRQFLLVQTDPENTGKRLVELKEVYGITNVFMQKLLMIQDEVKVRPVASITAEWLHFMTGAEGDQQQPPLQHSDSLAREEIYPHLLPSQSIQNEGVHPVTQGLPQRVPPNSPVHQSSLPQPQVNQPPVNQPPVQQSQ